MDRTRARLSPPVRLPTAAVAALVAAPAAFVAVFHLWPLATLVTRTVDAEAWSVLARRRTWDVVWFTTWQAAVSTTVAVAAGLPAAWAVARHRFPGRRLLLALLTSVFVLPTVVVGAAFVALLPDHLARSAVGIVAAHAVFNLAVVVRVVGTAWQHVPTDLEDAAATLGASPPQVARHVVFPILRPAIVAAASIVFVFCFTSFGVVRILGGPGRATIEVEVWRRATQLGDFGGAAVLSMLQLAALAVVIGWSNRSQRRHGRALDLRPLDRPGDGARAVTGRGRRLVVAAVATATAAVLLAPFVAMVERSLRTTDGYGFGAWRGLGATEVRPGIRLGIDPWSAIGASLRTTAVATIIAVTIGALAALAIHAARRRGGWLDAGLMLPLGTSAVTIGFGMLITFDRPPFDWRASWWLVPVGQALVAVPFVVRSTLGVLRSIDPRLTEAAATLGAPPVRAWRHLVLPVLRRPLVTGAGLAAAISLGEFGATSFLSRSGTETVPLAIERLLGRTGTVLQAQGFALATMLAIVTTAVVMAVDVFGSGPPRSTPRAGHRARRADRVAGPHGSARAVDTVNITDESGSGALGS